MYVHVVASAVVEVHAVTCMFMLLQIQRWKFMLLFVCSCCCRYDDGGSCYYMYAHVVAGTMMEVHVITCVFMLL